MQDVDLEENIERQLCKYKYNQMPENAWRDRWTSDNVRLALNEGFQWAFTLRNATENC